MRARTVGSGDFVAVEMQDGNDGAVASGIQELVGVPACCERAGLGFAVADDAADDEIGIIESGSVGVDQGVAEFATFVDGAGSFRRGVAGNAAGKRELLEQTFHALGVLGDVGEEFAVGAFEAGVGNHAGAAVAGAADVDHVEIVLFDEAVAMDVDEIESGRGAPVAQQSRLDVFQLERLA